MARARSKLETGAATRETASAVLRSRMPRETWLVLESIAGTSHHGHAPKGRDLSPMQCPSIGKLSDHNFHGTARARSKLETGAASRETASALPRSLMQRESRLILGGRSWHVSLLSRTEGERPPRRWSILS